MPTQIQGLTLSIPDGSLPNAAIASDAAIATSKLETRTSQVFPVPLTAGKVWDAVATNLPSAGANDDLGLITGTWGTDYPSLQTGDLKASNTTRRALYEIAVPQNYKDGGTFTVRVRGGMVTTVSDTTATVDLEVYKADGDSGVGSDLCQTDAATINSLTKANVDFTILATSLDPGDRLLARLSVAINDSATGTAVIGEISDILVICQTQG